MVHMAVSGLRGAAACRLMLLACDPDKDGCRIWSSICLTGCYLRRTSRESSYVSGFAVQGPPLKLALRVLTERFLKRRIQQGQHDSVIDARAALQLVCSLADMDTPAMVALWSYSRASTEVAAISGSPPFN